MIFLWRIFYCFTQSPFELYSFKPAELDEGLGWSEYFSQSRCLIFIDTVLTLLRCLGAGVEVKAMLPPKLKENCIHFFLRIMGEKIPCFSASNNHYFLYWEKKRRIFSFFIKLIIIYSYFYVRIIDGHHC